MVATIYVCYKVNSTAKVRNGYFRGIKIEFDKSIPVEKLPTKIEFYLTVFHLWSESLILIFLVGVLADRTRLGIVLAGLHASKHRFVTEESIAAELNAGGLGLLELGLAGRATPECLTWCLLALKIRLGACLAASPQRCIIFDWLLLA